MIVNGKKIHSQLVYNKRERLLWKEKPETRFKHFVEQLMCVMIIAFKFQQQVVWYKLNHVLGYHGDKSIKINNVTIKDE